MLLALAIAFVQADLKPQEFFLEGTTGRYLVLAPAAKNPKAHLWVGLHGGVGRAEEAVETWGPEAQKRGYVFVAVQGSAPPNVVREGCNSWDAVKDVENVNKIALKVAGEHGIDKKNIALMGFSRGGWMGMQTVAKHPDTFWFLGNISSMMWDGFDPKNMAPAAKKVAVFYGIGKNDQQAFREFRKNTLALQALGFNLQALALDDTGHEVNPLRRPMFEFYDQQFTDRANAQASQNTGAVAASGSTAAAGPTYASVQGIFNKACAGCHGAAQPKARLNLTSYGGLMAGGRRGPAIVPGDPESSLLYKLVTGQQQPKMPPGGNLSHADIKLLADWIRAGAKG